jgi:dTDP-4-amino-4,6-dideoxygalactose transaminase
VKGRLLTPHSRFRIYGGAGKYAMVARDLATGRALAGGAVEELESQIAALVGARQAVAMPQARVGIYLTLLTLLRPGQRVVLSPYTIHDVVNMVVCAGGVPVFADIERQTCNIDAAQVSALIDRDTGAVIVTHLHGLVCDVPRIARDCRAAGVPLLEDTAQAFGATLEGRRAGTFGAAGIYSFGMAKNVNSFYGGMVVTDDDRLAHALRRELRSCPPLSRGLLLKRAGHCLVGEVATAPPLFQAFTFWVYRYGHLHGIEAITNRWRGEDEPVGRREIPETYLRRMTPLQARLVRRALGEVEAHTRARVANARRYDAGLAGVSEVIRPPLRLDGAHIYLTYPIQVEDRHGLLRFLIKHARDLALQHIGNTADYECFAQFRRDCPNARWTAERVLLLPTYPGYPESEIDRNIALIRRYFGGGGPH